MQNPFTVGVGADPKSSTVNIVQVGQSGLGLPDRDYYCAQIRRSPRRAMRMSRTSRGCSRSAKQPDAAGAAKRILALETAIATPQWDRAKSRDRNLAYNKMTVAELAAATPSYDWNAYLKAAGLSSAKDVIVRQPDYVKAMNDVVAKTPASTWREYLTFKLLDRYANELPAAFRATRGSRSATPR